MEGKYVVVTGASSGIGYETAKAFARLGRNLVIAARREERLEALKREILAECPERDVVIRVVDLSVSENVLSFYESLRGYPLEAWVNNAGFGYYGSVWEQSPEAAERMIRLNVTALTLLSVLFVREYRDVEGAQLINVSSCGGYTLVPDAVVYCAAKHYVSAFTEGLSRELAASGAKLRAKVLAPAATETEFGKIANHTDEYDYGKRFGAYHTARQTAAFLLELYGSDAVVGLVDRETFRFELSGGRLPNAWASLHNQK